MAVPASFDLDLLRSFVAIAEEKSFTRAATRVGRTQAAVSLQVQRLEGMLGKTVIVRGKGGSVELNSDGLQLLERARELSGAQRRHHALDAGSSGSWHDPAGDRRRAFGAISAANPRPLLPRGPRR